MQFRVADKIETKKETREADTRKFLNIPNILFIQQTVHSLSSSGVPESLKPPHYGLYGKEADMEYLPKACIFCPF